MKSIKLFLLTIVMLLGTEGADIATALKEAGCDRGYKVYKDINCVNPDKEFIYNLDNTLSCKEDGNSIFVEWVPMKDIDTPVRYIDCKEGNATATCMPEFKQIDDTCVKISDNIIFKETDFVCDGRMLRYTPFNITDEEGELPHLVCMKKLRIVESLLSPANVDRFHLTVPVLGKTIVSVSKQEAIMDIKLIRRGIVITLSNKEKGIIALSDIIDLKRADLPTYILAVKELKETIKRVIKEDVIHAGLSHKVLGNAFKMSELMLADVDDKLLDSTLGPYNSKTFRLTILHLSTVLVGALEGIDETNRDIVIQYILEEYFYMYELVYRDSKKL